MIELDFATRNTQPYLNVGLIKTTWSDGSTSIGTFSLVGRNDILTAGHCVYSPTEGGWATGFEFYFGADYNSTTGQFESWIAKADYSQWNAYAWTSQIYTDGNHATMLQSEAQFDVALIGIDTPIGDSLGWLGLAPGYDGYQIGSAVGYPAGSTGMMQETVSVTRSSAYGLYESSVTSLGPGSSGGPLLMGNYVIGVKSTSNWWADLGSSFIYDNLVSQLSANDSMIGGGYDTTAPKAVSFVPADGTNGVSPATNIVITFNESVQRGTGSIQLRVNSASGTIVETFDAASSARLGFAGQKLTIDPSKNLAPLTKYVLVLPSGAVKDLAGNAYAGTSTYDFTSALYGTNTHDTLVGGAGHDVIHGLDGNDSITAGLGNDTVTGGAGNDVLDGGAGLDRMTGGDGNDRYYVRESGDSVIETNASASSGGYDTVLSYLSAYSLGANIEYGRIVAAATANLTGNALSNVLYAGAGNNVIDGAGGSDTVSYAYATAGVVIDLRNTSTAQATRGSGSDLIRNVENVSGSNYNDSLTGNAAANVLSGGAGADTLRGLEGADRLLGGAGNDVLDGGTGVDTMTGGDGNDVYYVRDVGDVVSETNATLTSGGTDTAYSYLSALTLGANVENGRIVSGGTATLTGNALNNVLYAGTGNNVLNGGAGVDTVSYAYGAAGGVGVKVSLALTTPQATGGSGTDTLLGIERLVGSAYADTLAGNGASNVFTGGGGRDVLRGNGGNDVFDFNALAEMGTTSTTWDVITDFNAGDRIDLSTLDANTATTANDAFSATFVSTFTRAGQLKFAGGVLYGNVDADSTPEFAIALTGVSALSPTSVVL